MSYLSSEEIAALLKKLEGDDYNIAVLCLSTGARWAEAVRLKREHIIQNKVRFTYTKTRKPRIVPISDELAELICGIKRPAFPEGILSAFQEDFKRDKALFTGRTGNPCSETFFRNALHDERREHYHIAAVTWSLKPQPDDDLCALCA